MKYYYNSNKRINFISLLNIKCVEEIFNFLFSIFIYNFLVFWNKFHMLFILVIIFKNKNKIHKKILNGNSNCVSILSAQ